MSDFTHCQLLYSPLSSSAFLNMHALHFLTTFQIQMDVPCSRLHSLLPPLPYCFCSLQLCFICGWPNFQVWSILWCRGRLWSSRLTDWLTDRHKAHQRAGIDAYAVPTHPFARMNPSLSASWCQTQIRFFVFAAPDTNMLPPPALPQHHLLFGLKTELQAHPSFHWLAVTACTTLQLHKFRSL